MKLHAAITATAATLMLGGCMTVPDRHPLTDTQWQLAAIDTSGSTTTLTPAMQQRHTIAFMEDGAMTLQLDCNRGRASWTAGKPQSGAGSISIGPVASTRMACPPPSFGNELAALTDAQRYTTTMDGRQLVIETPQLRYTFTAAAQ